MVHCTVPHRQDPNCFVPFFDFINDAAEVSFGILAGCGKTLSFLHGSI
jgi:hypothetical protein